jgi:hypothetical protein
MGDYARAVSACTVSPLLGCSALRDLESKGQVHGELFAARSVGSQPLLIEAWPFLRCLACRGYLIRRGWVWVIPSRQAVLTRNTLAALLGGVVWRIVAFRGLCWNLGSSAMSVMEFLLAGKWGNS